MRDAVKARAALGKSVTRKEGAQLMTLANLEVVT